MYIYILFFLSFIEQNKNEKREFYNKSIVKKKKEQVIIINDSYITKAKGTICIAS
jgi:hypothetical protein